MFAVVIQCSKIKWSLGQCVLGRTTGTTPKNAHTLTLAPDGWPCQLLETPLDKRIMYLDSFNWPLSTSNVVLPPFPVYVFTVKPSNKTKNVKKNNLKKEQKVKFTIIFIVGDQFGSKIGLKRLIGFGGLSGQQTWKLKSPRIRKLLNLCRIKYKSLVNSLMKLNWEV